MHQDWAQAHSVPLPNESESVDLRTKGPSTQPSLLRKEESSRERCDENLGSLLPRVHLEPRISKSVAREDVPHFLEGQQRKSEGEFI